MAINLPVYSQWGQPWSSKKLGTSPYSMGTDGCFVTSVTALMSPYQIKLDPGQVLDKLNAVGAIDQWGFLDHNKIGNAFPWVYFYGRERTTNDPTKDVSKKTIDAAMRSIKKFIDIGNPVVLTVDNMKNDGIPDHAVAAEDYILKNNVVSDFTIMDPDGGKKILFSSKYGDPWKKLYGYIAFIGPTQEFRDGASPEMQQASGAMYDLSQFRKRHQSDLNKLQYGFFVKAAMERFVE